MEAHGILKSREIILSLSAHELSLNCLAGNTLLLIGALFSVESYPFLTFHLTVLSVKQTIPVGTTARF